MLPRYLPRTCHYNDLCLDDYWIFDSIDKQFYCVYCFKRCLYAFRLAFIPLYRVCRSCFRSVLTNYVASHCVLPPAMPCTIFSALPPLLHCPASLGSPPLAASPVIMHSKIKMEGTRCLSFAWPNIRLTKVGLGLVPERLPKLIQARAEGFSPSQAKPSQGTARHSSIC